jgi:hypothetical protein
MTEPAIYRIVVFLKDWEVEATEPMSEEVARAELESLWPQVRVVRNPLRMIRVGPNVLVRAGDIKRVKLVKIEHEDTPEA